MKVIFTISILFLSHLFYAQTVLDTLNNKLQLIADEKVIPGFGAMIIQDGVVKYSEGFGFANVENEIPYTVQTLQNIASISKTFIGVSLMIAEEKGLLDLDDPINKYLDYKIINPHYPEDNVTIRHLATHTSTLDDTDGYERAYIFEQKIDIDSVLLPSDWKEVIDLYNSNTRVSLDDFIKSIYVPGGQYYAKENFIKEKPGVKFEYSNMGAGIASKIIENASGMSFENFTQTYIFDPIGMRSTSWSLEKIELEKKATPYMSYDIPIPHYSLITLADGGVITNIQDLGLYVLEMMNCYFGEGTILPKAQSREMMKPFLPYSDSPYGIFWESTPVRIGHNGGDPGTVTTMYFMPDSKVATISFMNIMPTDEETMNALSRIWKTLKNYQLRI